MEMSPANPHFFCLTIRLYLATSQVIDIALEKCYVSNYLDLDDSRRFAFFYEQTALSGVF